MTDSQQRRFYFPHWNACMVANGWIMVKGRLATEIADCGLRIAEWPDPAKDLGLNVLAIAEKLALREHCAVTAEHLRHACNLVASGGRRSSSADLDNRETSRVVALFRLLKDPEDLDAVMEWLNPEKADQRSLVAWLRKKAPEATIIAIARNAFRTSDWETLEISKLKWLAKQLKDRTDSFHRPSSTNYLRRRRQYAPGPY